MPRPVEKNSVRFPAKKTKQIKPGTRKSVGSANPFRPTTLKMVEEWINQQEVNPLVKEELIKMIRNTPNGALDHFQENIQTYIGIAVENIRKIEG